MWTGIMNDEHDRLVRGAASFGEPQRDFRGFDLSRSLLQSSQLNGADLSEANLSRASLSGSYFRGANFSDANLKKASLSTADLREANFTGADLTECDLNGSVLLGGTLARANLTKACLVKVHLAGVDLSGATLDRTDFRGVIGLTKEQLESGLEFEKAILDEKTLKHFGLKGSQNRARHGRKRRQRRDPNSKDILFTEQRPMFGDLFQIVRDVNPNFPPSETDFGFEKLGYMLGVEQLDDYFAICVNGDPVIWLYPLVKGHDVDHHPGPFDGIRIDLVDTRFKSRWNACVTKLVEEIKVPMKVV